MDWALSSRAARSQFQGRLDRDKVATMGRSCGGLQALRAGLDARVGSVVALHTGYFPEPRLGFDIAELQRLEAPTLFANGGPSDVAYANSRNNYQLAPVPAALVEFTPGGHHGITSGQNNGEIESEDLYTGVQTAVQWLDYTLHGDQEARRYFAGPGCGLCDVSGWSVTTKNLP
jgi:dienelactone hydrolase